MTACAPKRYQGPQRSSTAESALRTSTAAGSIGTAQQLGEPRVRGEVGAAIGWRRPTRVQCEHLAAKLVGSAEALGWSENTHLLRPVPIFRGAHGLPVAGH